MRVVGFLLLAFGFLATSSAYAQSVVGEDTGELTKPKTDVAAQGPDMFGDTVSLYTGETEFAVTDVNIPGNNAIPVALGRRYVVHDIIRPLIGSNIRAFGDWDLDIPHLHGVFPATTGPNTSGWQVSTPSLPNNRCSVDRSNYIQGTPPNANGTPAYPFSSAEYWSGNMIYVPGVGDQKMMVIDPSNALRPTDGADYFWTTSNQWVASCAGATANGIPGEAFVFKSPAGLTYRFDWFAKRFYTSLSKPYAVCTGGCISYLNRNEEWIMPTQVSDRFGNWVRYTYDPSNTSHLMGITSSDGRAIALTYDGNGRIQTVSSGGRTWNYTYAADGRLTVVRLPDTVSTWTYDFSQMNELMFSYSLHSDCADPASFATSTATVTATSPTGASGSFTFTTRRHGRSNVPMVCSYLVGGDSYATESNVIDAYSIDQKQITGSSISTPLTWSYAYGAANASWQATCNASGCPTTKIVVVTNPDTSWVRHTFSNQYNQSEGRESLTETGDGAGHVWRVESLTYQTSPAGQPYPALIGKSPCNRCDKDGQIFLPLLSRTLVQDQTTYASTVNSFDAYARATSVTKSSTSYSKTDGATFSDNTNLWVLGQVASSTTNGTATAETTFDATTALPTSSKSFGLVVRTYTFNADGTLSQAKDGRGLATNYSGWLRGKPGRIDFADALHAVYSVDAFGNVTSIQDRAGYTTGYTYDALDRVVRVDYPADTRAWNYQTITYTPSATTERGISGTHWVRTATKGGGASTTYYDGLMRPVLVDNYVAGDASSYSTRETDYDPNGQVQFTSYEKAGAPNLGGFGGVGSWTYYDALDRVRRVEQSTELASPSVQTIAYIANAGVQVTNPKNVVTTTYYQSYDTPTYDLPVSVAKAAGVTQVVVRDDFGGPKTIHQYGTFAGLSGDIVKSIDYDSNHRVCRTDEPETGSRLLGYDAASNIAWLAEGQTRGTGCVTDAANKTVYTYNAMNRLETETPAAPTQATGYTYAPEGQITQAVSGISTWMATYNALGKPTGESLTLTDQPTRAIGYAYDLNGNLSGIQYPDATFVDLAPDSLGRPTKFGAYASAVHYHPNGEISDFLFGNGEQYMLGQNTRQLPENFSYGKGAALDVSEDFAYDANGNTSSISNFVDNTRSKSFAYDDLDRVTGATALLWGSETYTYDPLNNLRSITSGAQVRTFNYNPINLLGSISDSSGATSSFAYDPRGNVIARVGTILSFDNKNQLSSVSGQETYAYDYAGRRVKKVPASGGPTYYFYSHDGRLMYQFEPNSAKSTDFIYAGSKLIARDVGTQLGSPASLTVDANPNNGDFSLTWPAVAQATSYTLQESTDGATWTTLSSTATSATTISSKVGGTYFYRVAGCMGAVCGPWVTSEAIGVRPALAVITVPTGIVNGTYSVSWTVPATATTFDVQERLGTGAWTTIGTDLTGTSISRPGTSSGSYTYQVSAKSAYGTRGWASSGAVNVDTTYGVLPATPPSLSVPSASANGAATLTWPAVSLSTRYVVEQSANNGASWTAVYNSTGTSTTVSGLAGGTYVFHVQACNTYGCSAWQPGNTSLVVTYPPAGVPAISAPSSSPNGAYTVSWSGVGGASSYQIQESVNGGAFNTVQNNGATAWGTSGRGNASYGYRVQACNVGGCGPWSGTTTVTVLLPPGAPAGVSVPGSSSGSVGVSWSASATTSYYNLFQSLNGGGWSGPVYQGGATSATIGESASGTYKFGAQACNASGCSGITGSGNVSVVLPPGTPPIPSITATTFNHKVTVLVTCAAQPEATSFHTEETLPGATTPWATTNICGYNGFVYGQGYVKFRVQACNASGCSAWSGYAQVYVNSN